MHIQGLTPDLVAIALIKRAYTRKLLKSRNVIACGVGFKESEGQLTSEPCVVVSVSKKIPKSQLSEQDLVPPQLESVKTDVQELGLFRAQEINTKTKHRPAMPGISCGHSGVSAGTFGCLVRRGQEVFILSNNHVLAHTNKAHKDDPILQPAAYDGGTLSEQIATLENWVPLKTGASSSSCKWAGLATNTLNTLAKWLGSDSRIEAVYDQPQENTVDCAIARPLSPYMVTPDIPIIERPLGVALGTLGMNVQKMGRTTGYTTGSITQIDVTVQVDYDGQPVTFVDQLMASGMSAGGDSGSAVLDMGRNVIGLLFAGSGLATLINPIQLVLQALDVEVVT